MSFQSMFNQGYQNPYVSIPTSISNNNNTTQISNFGLDQTNEQNPYNEEKAKVASEIEQFTLIYNAIRDFSSQINTKNDNIQLRTELYGLSII